MSDDLIEVHGKCLQVESEHAVMLMGPCVMWAVNQN